MTTEKEQAEAIRSERNIGFSRGPLFLEKDGVTMFQYTLDSSSIVGPRKATQADKDEHKGAWEAFNKDRLPQLDRDGDGFPGGSLPQTIRDADGGVAFERPLRPVSEDHVHVDPAPRRGRPPKLKD